MIKLSMVLKHLITHLTCTRKNMSQLGDYESLSCDAWHPIPSVHLCWLGQPKLLNPLST